MPVLTIGKNESTKILQQKHISVDGAWTFFYQQLVLVPKFHPAC